MWRYFTLRMRGYPWHISIRLANIYSILSSINIYPLLNTVLKMKPVCAQKSTEMLVECWCKTEAFFTSDHRKHHLLCRYDFLWTRGKNVYLIIEICRKTNQRPVALWRDGKTIILFTAVTLFYIDKHWNISLFHCNHIRNSTRLVTVFHYLELFGISMFFAFRIFLFCVFVV